MYRYEVNVCVCVCMCVHTHAYINVTHMFALKFVLCFLKIRLHYGKLTIIINPANPLVFKVINNYLILQYNICTQQQARFWLIINMDWNDYMKGSIKHSWMKSNERYIKEAKTDRICAVHKEAKCLLRDYSFTSKYCQCWIAISCSTMPPNAPCLSISLQ